MFRRLADLIPPEPVADPGAQRADRVFSIHPADGWRKYGHPADSSSGTPSPGTPLLAIRYW